ncbi:MAG: pre-peptidase C-terminal domain-containing protein [Clostridia bacterium]|nr:pre-peptidase C-terminal domain-containing protein [Clostridia bacterium]
MKRNIITTAVAVCLVLLLAFSPSVPVAETVSTGGTLLAGDNISIKTENLDALSLGTAEQSTSDYQVDTQGVPGGSTAVTPDEVLPDSEAEDVEQSQTSTESAGTTVVPVKINNIIRDSLANIISTNIYTFSVSQRGVMIFAFNHTDVQTASECLWYITLYEEYSPDGMGKTYAYRELERISYTSVGTSCQSGAIGVSAGNYRIKVECISGYTAEKFDLAIGFAKAADYEIEPNNSQTRYSELSLDKTVNGSASLLSEDTDEDWYMFEVTQEGYVVLYFEHEADTEESDYTVAWRIRLTDMQGNEYFYTTSGMGAASVNSGVMGLEPGYYFVTVYSHVHTAVSYALNVSFTKDSSIEKELNDSVEIATPVAVNTEIVGSLTERNDASDRDYYSFTMENDGFIVIDFVHEALSEQKDGWHISVVSENGDVAYDAVSDWSQNVLQSPNIGISAGKYFIVIDSDNIYHSNIVYRLLLMTESDSSWESEPNNTIEKADIITLGKPVNGSMIEYGTDFDEDYYKVELDAAGTLQIDFAHTASVAEAKEGWIISVLDSNGNVLSSQSADWNSGTVTFTAEISESGAYYILVESGLYFNADRYSITANFG